MRRGRERKREKRWRKAHLEQLFGGGPLLCLVLRALIDEVLREAEVRPERDQRERATGESRGQRHRQRENRDS